MKNHICLICHEKGKTHEMDQLQRISILLEGTLVTRETLEAGHGMAFLWDIHSRCPYGMTCPERQSYKSAFMNKARSMEEQLIAFAINSSDGKFHEMLCLLRGHFPAVYRTMERLRAASILDRRSK